MTDQEQSAGEVRDPAEDYKPEFSDAEQVHHDDTDVESALERETDDGKGGAVVPKEDFESYTDPTAEQAEQETQS